MAKLLWNKRMRGSKKGEIGISTLIIFIALVLVAAIAASVIISTTFSLRDQAIATSESARKEVTGPIKVLNFYGDRDPAGSGVLATTLNQLVMHLAIFDGAQGINMVNMRLNYVDRDVSVVYTMRPCTNLGSVTTSPTGSRFFYADEIPTGTAGNGWAPNSQLCFLDNENILEIRFDVSPGNTGAANGLLPGTTVQLNFLPGSGPAVTKTFSTPTSYDNDKLITLL